MAIAALSRAPTIIKPGDLVRLPSGATGFVDCINADGSRDVRLTNGELVTIKARLLFLVRASVPKPWPSRGRL